MVLQTDVYFRYRSFLFFQWTVIRRTAPIHLPVCIIVAAHTCVPTVLQCYLHHRVR